MGARQVHRNAVSGRLSVALGLAVLLLGVTVSPAAADDEPIILVDLRPGAGLPTSRAALRAELEKVSGIEVLADDGLDGALAGEASDTDAPGVLAALAEAREAYGALDCARARAASDRAIDLLAGRQAAGLDDGIALRSGWAYVLLCADRDNDRAVAQTAADRLRALGVLGGEEAGISVATWEKYPEIDATTDRDLVELTIDATAPGASVWIDHAWIGKAPVSAYVTAGEHVIAAGDGPHRGAARIVAAGKAMSATIAMTDRTGPYSAVAGVVKGWRDGALTPTAEALGTVMQTLDVRFALVLAGKDTVQIWALGPGEDKPRKVDDSSRDDTMAIGSMILDRVAAWDGNAPDPDLPLLRETPEDRAHRTRGTPTRWWIYATIVGAVLVGTTVLYFQDTADDRQRIEIRFP